MRRPTVWLAAVLAAVAVACVPKTPPPAVVTSPRFPTYPQPEIPAALRASRDVVARHDLAWRRLQSGDLRGASRDFASLLKQQPTLYPAETGLGFVHLAGREFKTAASLFSAVVAREARYVPALIGLAEAQVGLNNDGQAIAALERVLAIDPKREAVRTRLELVRFRMVQSLIDEGRRARQANKLDVAEQAFEQALTISPASTLILRELAQVELLAGRADDAEGHVRQAIKLDAGDAEGHAALGDVLEARGRFRDAAASYRRAVSLDDRPEWRKLAGELSEKADMAALPREFGNLSGATTITRAHVAAYVGIRLGTLIEAAPTPCCRGGDRRRASLGVALDPVGDAGRRDERVPESHLPARHGGPTRGPGTGDGAADRAGCARPLHRACRLAGRTAALSRPATVERVLSARSTCGHRRSDVCRRRRQFPVHAAGDRRRPHQSRGPDGSTLVKVAGHGRAHRRKPADAPSRPARTGVRAVHALRPAGMGARDVCRRRRHRRVRRIACAMARSADHARRLARSNGRQTAGGCDVRDAHAPRRRPRQPDSTLADRARSEP